MTDETKDMCNQFVKFFFTSFTREPEKLAGFYTASENVCASFGVEASTEATYVSASDIEGTVKKMNLSKDDTVLVTSHDILESNGRYLINVVATVGGRKFVQSFFMTKSAEGSFTIDGSIFRWIKTESAKPASAEKKTAASKPAASKPAAKTTKATDKSAAAGKGKVTAKDKPAAKGGKAVNKAKQAKAENTKASESKIEKNEQADTAKASKFEDIQKEDANDVKPAHTGPKSWAMIAAKDGSGNDTFVDEPRKIVPRVEKQPDPKVLLAKQKKRQANRNSGTKRERTGPKETPKSRVLYVSKLPADATAEQLATLFAEFGKVEEPINIQKEKSIAFVTLDTPEAATAAVKRGSESEFSVGDSKISVAFQKQRFGKQRGERRKDGPNRDNRKKEGGRPRDGQRKDGGRPRDGQKKDGGRPRRDGQSKDGAKPRRDGQNKDGAKPRRDGQNKDGAKPRRDGVKPAEGQKRPSGRNVDRKDLKKDGVKASAKTGDKKPAAKPAASSTKPAAEKSS